MNLLHIYRRRFIPDEYFLLKGDEILKADDEIVITKWDTINAKTEFRYGCSCYFLKEGIKVSKFYRHDKTLLYWYCDIVDFEYDARESSLIVTDLLADVIVYPDGTVKVVDLDELADAFERRLISEKLINSCLRRLNSLLNAIYQNHFDRYQNCLDSLGL